MPQDRTLFHAIRGLKGQKEKAFVVLIVHVGVESVNWLALPKFWMFIC